MAHDPTRVEGRATSATVRGWQVQSSSAAGGSEAGEVVSMPGHRAASWLEAAPRSTVMAAMLANGRYPGIEYSDRIRHDVDPAMFEVPWWFRTTFHVSGDARTTVRSDGIIHRAELFVNGTKVAGSDVIAGAYTTNAFDVTELVRPGLNALAYLVHPGDPKSDLSIGWVDWNWWPPDNNMGIWRDVVLLRTGPVRLSRPRVTSRLDDDLRTARLRLTVDVENLGDEDHVVGVAGAITRRAGERAGGDGTRIRIERQVAVRAGRCERVLFSHEDDPELVLRSPALWWPVGEGEQPCYELELTAAAEGRPSDRVGTQFGIRSVASHIEDGGGRRFVVNGRPVAIRGAGWAPDLWLRHDRQRLSDELSYALGAGLNAIRLEGKLENPEIYELADEIGLMMLPGWECCDKWEAHAGSGAPWVEADFEVAARSMSSEAYRLANHPSVVGFFIGSDHPPEPRAARLYVDALAEAGWDVPVISSATVEGSEVAGPSGMKMTGPYAWVPPAYWYRTDEQLGGAVGFNSETGSGNNLPRRPSLDRMLSEPDLEALWSQPLAGQTHAAPESVFETLAMFHGPLAARYGRPTSLDDFLRKAHLANYESVRAQFEAYGARTGAARPATGMVYWMLNSAWPSLNWQLWDWYLDPGPAYFAARKANEPVHVQYAYDAKAAQVVNRTGSPVRRLVVRAHVRTLDGEVVWNRLEELHEVGAGETVTAFGIEVPAGVSGAYFLELDVEGLASLPLDGPPAAGLLSRNVYWLSTVPDVLALERTAWHSTPLESPADLTGLTALPLLTEADLDVSTRWSEHGGLSEVTVSVTNAAAATPLVGLHVSVVSVLSASEGREPTRARPVAPIHWDDNDVVLFGQQAASLTASFHSDLLGAAVAALELDGFNLVGPVRILRG